MKIHYLLAIAISLFFLHPSEAQDLKDVIDYSGFNFKEDSVQSFQNNYTAFTSIGSVKDSKAQIELRFYKARSGRIPEPTILYLVKLSADRVEATIFIACDLRDRHNIRNAELIEENDRQACFKVQKRTISRSSFSPLMNQLAHNRLFDLPDQKDVIDSLRKNKTEVNSLCHNQNIIRSFDCIENFSLLEIKVGRKYRNFKSGNQAAYYCRYNPRIDLFEYYESINNLFQDIFRL